MKTVRQIGVLLMAWLLASCANSDDAIRELMPTEPGITELFGADGTAYLALQVNMGGTTTTRAGGENGTFEDGTAGEMAVANAYLLLFHGSSEATATLASAYALTGSDASESIEQVEKRRTYVQQIRKDNIAATDNLYAYMLLNAYDDLSVSISNGPVVTIGGTTLTASSTLSDLQAITIDRVKGDIGGTEYFIMSNAPVSTAAGGTQASAPSGAVNTLVQIPTSKIYTTQALAEAETAPVQVNVERAAVKITVAVGSITSITSNSAELDIDPVSDITWTLDLENTTTYLTRHFSASWLTLTAGSNVYRFADATAIDPSAPTPAYRTYWAEDPNYDNNTSLATAKTVATATFGTTETFYTLENTFDYDAQKSLNATALLVRLRLNGGNDFYTVSTAGQDDIYQVEDNEPAAEEGTGASSSFAPRRSSKIVTRDIDDYVRDWLIANVSGLSTWITNYAGGDKRFIKVNMTNDAVTGTATAQITQTAQKSNAAATEFNALGLDAEVAAAMTFKYFANGYCYYRGLIKHFGNELTPWTSGDYTEALHLGRYGLARDNCYRLTIGSFAHIGEPIIPAPADARIDQ